MAKNTVYSCARCSSYLLCSTVCGQPKRLLGPRRQMRLLTGPGVFTKRYASFTVSPQDWLHDWLTRACMSCLAFSGPTPSSSSSPVGAWPAAQPRAAPAPRWATAAVRTARARAALHGLPLVRLAHWLLGGKGQQIHPTCRTMLQQIHRQL